MLISRTSEHVMISRRYDPYYSRQEPYAVVPHVRICAGELANVFCMIISVPEFCATQEETAEVAQVVVYDSSA